MKNQLLTVNPVNPSAERKKRREEEKQRKKRREEKQRKRMREERIENKKALQEAETPQSALI